MAAEAEKLAAKLAAIEEKILALETYHENQKMRVEAVEKAYNSIVAVSAGLPDRVDALEKALEPFNTAITTGFKFSTSQEIGEPGFPTQDLILRVETLESIVSGRGR